MKQELKEAFDENKVTSANGIEGVPQIAKVVQRVVTFDKEEF